MTTFDQVVAAWEHAHVDAIHPLRGKDVDEYWASGWAQAEHAATYLPDGGRVLDFGCGEGRLAIPLAEFGYDVYAADSSTAMLQRVEQNAALFAVKRPTLIWSNGFVSESELPDDCDVVVCRAVLIHHDHGDGARLVQTLAESLKHGGHLIVDWPIGVKHTRTNWIDVTVWDVDDRSRVAAVNGLTLVDEQPHGLTVWQRR